LPPIIEPGNDGCFAVHLHGRHYAVRISVVDLGFTEAITECFASGRTEHWGEGPNVHPTRTSARDAAIHRIVHTLWRANWALG
jgi:hypothetical protein